MIIIAVWIGRIIYGEIQIAQKNARIGLLRIKQRNLKQMQLVPGKDPMYYSDIIAKIAYAEVEIIELQNELKGTSAYTDQLEAGTWSTLTPMLTPSLGNKLSGVLGGGDGVQSKPDSLSKNDMVNWLVSLINK